jgi:hypothetical protein
MLAVRLQPENCRDDRNPFRLRFGGCKRQSGGSGARLDELTSR